VSRGEHKIFCNQEACCGYFAWGLIGKTLFLSGLDLADCVEGKLRVLVNAEFVQKPAVISLEDSFIASVEAKSFGIFAIHFIELML
jgi:hypothetical protein